MGVSTGARPEGLLSVQKRGTSLSEDCASGTSTILQHPGPSTQGAGEEGSLERGALAAPGQPPGHIGSPWSGRRDEQDEQRPETRSPGRPWSRPAGLAEGSTGRGRQARGRPPGRPAGGERPPHPQNSCHHTQASNPTKGQRGWHGHPAAEPQAHGSASFLLALRQPCAGGEKSKAIGAGSPPPPPLPHPLPLAKTHRNSWRWDPHTQQHSLKFLLDASATPPHSELQAAAKGLFFLSARRHVVGSCYGQDPAHFTAAAPWLAGTPSLASLGCSDPSHGGLQRILALAFLLLRLSTRGTSRFRRP